ncbi:MAG TPA: VWA domain-containing protein, partial [bacterium]
MEYSLLLKLDGDLVQFTYPLHGRIESERFFPRPPRPYPGPPYLIPLQDGEKEAPAKDEKDPKRLTDISQIIFIDLKSKIPLKNIYSPSHEVDISRADDHHAKISYEGKRRDSEDNFVLYYSLSQKDFGLSLLTYRPEEKENGFFMLLISPKTEIAKDEIINKDLVFILDVSGSMDGEKIKQAKDALQYCIKNLDNDDRFNLISFSTESKLFKKGLVSASEFRNDAINYIDKLEAKGGTNINEALLDALKIEGNVRRPMSLVFITDGLPTVGETNIGNIIDNVAKENKEKIKIFTFGVGYDVNTVLLDKIASVNRAVSDYIEPNEDIDRKISSFYDKISHPVLTDLEINYGKIEIEDVYPKKLPDLYQGSQLTVLGRFADEKNTAITLTGKTKDKENKFTYDADFSAPKKENDFLPHLWATRKIGYLMDEIRLHGENKELKEEIIRLSKKYGVMSPYTSFLVQEEMPLAQSMNARPDVGSYRRMEKKSVDYNLTVGAEEHAPATAPMDQGVYAVKYSKASREMKEKESGLSKDSDYIKRIGGRTFYWQDSLWVDSEYKNEKTIDIKYGSQAYMNLFLSYPEAA